ncbi:hypothetical protein HK097_004578 [Rhizophlyctis rosea]|uniref:Tyrosinase copper-binding domain-containing protein n=1 Tax=Rhizophlyctis rosea TaxID=64517 RepID=A0AAD5X3H5_9FUNG|nr:hypothetical protein HK097_004578 [Rhizophlyctis rosea]
MKFSSIASAFVAALTFTTGVTAQVSGWDSYANCTKIDVRKEVHDMTAADWERWRKVIRAAATDYNTTILDLAKLPLANYNGDSRNRLTKYQNDLKTVGGSMSVWDQLGWLHNAYHVPIHGNHIFLIWHRHFTRWVEQILQRYDPEFTWFYWATHLMADARIWQTDPVWEHMGKAVYGKDLTDGPLAGIILRGNVGTVSKLRGLYREYTLSNTTYYRDEDSEWSTLDNYNYAYSQSIKSTGGYQEYAYWAEGYHAYVHISQGGVMSGMASPLDPMFFAHHSNVDYLYHTAQEGWNVKDKRNQAWQIRGSCPANADDSARCLTLNTRLPYFEIPVSEVQFISQQCIKYAPPIVGPWTGKPPTTTTTTTTTTTRTTTTTTPAPITSTTAAPTPTSEWVRPTFPSGTRLVGSNSKCGTSNNGAVCNVNLCCAYPLNTKDFYCGNTAKHCGANRCNPAFGSCWANATLPDTTTTSSRTTLPVTTTTTTTTTTTRTTTTTTRTIAPSPTSIFIRNTFPSGTRYVGSNTKCGSSNGGAVCNVNLCCAYPLNTNDFYCGNTAKHCAETRCNPTYGSCWANGTHVGTARRRRAVDLSIEVNLGGSQQEDREGSTSTSSYIKPSATTVEETETESSFETTTAAETATETISESETATETAIPPEEGGYVVLEPVTYESKDTPLHKLPNWWLAMQYQGPNAPSPVDVGNNLYQGCKEVAEAVKNKVVIEAPVAYMQNNYTGVLPVVPTSVVEEVYPEAIVSYGKPTYVPVIKKKCRKHTTPTAEPTDVPAYGAEETTPSAGETELYGKFY